MKVIIDTNLVFSAILNTKSAIGDLILNSGNAFQFYSCHYLWYEIDIHRNKLKRISRLSGKELFEIEHLIYSEIKFIDEEQIPKDKILQAIKLVEDIDHKDIAFIALAEYYNSNLWTGDKKMLQGLKAKGYNKVLSTEEMIELRLKLEKKNK